VFTRSAITPPKVNRFGWNLENSVYIVGQILWAIHAVVTAGEPGKILYFCQVSNARFHRFTKGQISRNLNTTRRSVYRVALKTLKTEFWKFYLRDRFSKKKFSKIFNILRLQAAITPQWLDRRKCTTKFLVSISTIGINSKSFPWNVHSVQETSPNFLRRHHSVAGSQSPSTIESHDTRPRRMQEVNSLCIDRRALRAEYCIVVVGIPHNTAI